MLHLGTKVIKFLLNKPAEAFFRALEILTMILIIVNIVHHW